MDKQLPNQNANLLASTENLFTEKEFAYQDISVLYVMSTKLYYHGTLLPIRSSIEKNHLNLFEPIQHKETSLKHCGDSDKIVFFSAVSLIYTALLL